MEEPVPAAVEVMHESKVRTSSSLWMADAAILFVYTCVVGWTIQYHEKWADEAQAWLIARDLSLKAIWFHELRYEGSPGLWHTILWVAQHVFHAGYDSISYIGMFFAICGAAVLLFLAPFPRVVRWPLAFTYVMLYQYAVIARPYTLMPLLAFTAAYFFRDTAHPERITLALIVLANLTSHGALFAACLGLGYLIQIAPSWSMLEPQVRRRYLVCVVAFVLALIFVFAVIKPTPDVQEIAIKKELAGAPQSVRDTFPGPIKKMAVALTGAFLDFPLLSALFVIFCAAWCYIRKKLVTFALPVGILIGFYGLVHGAAHHHGTIFVAAIAGLWISWPSHDELQALTRHQELARRGVIAALLCLCAVNIWDSIVVIHREYLYPYSGARDAADYLRSVGADKTKMFGFLHGIVGIQAYFDHNIFANVPNSYFHHGVPLAATTLDLEELDRAKPDYIVGYSEDPNAFMQVDTPQLTALGFELVHFSDGYYLYKRIVYERDVYFIFRRTRNDP